MSQELVPETINYTCSYCGGPITSVLEQYRFTDVCPHCRGSVMIPRPAAAQAVNATSDELNAPHSGEFPVANMERKHVAAVAVAAAPTVLAFADSDKIALPEVLNEHAQHVSRLESTTRDSSLMEPVASNLLKSANASGDEPHNVFVFKPTLTKDPDPPTPLPAPAPHLESDTKVLSALTAEKIDAELHKIDNAPEMHLPPPPHVPAHISNHSLAHVAAHVSAEHTSHPSEQSAAASIPLAVSPEQATAPAESVAPQEQAAAPTQTPSPETAPPPGPTPIPQNTVTVPSAFKRPTHVRVEHPVRQASPSGQNLEAVAIAEPSTPGVSDVANAGAAAIQESVKTEVAHVEEMVESKTEPVVANVLNEARASVEQLRPKSEITMANTLILTGGTAAVKHIETTAGEVMSNSSPAENTAAGSADASSIPTMIGTGLSEALHAAAKEVAPEPAPAPAVQVHPPSEPRLLSEEYAAERAARANASAAPIAAMSSIAPVVASKMEEVAPVVSGMTANTEHLVGEVKTETTQTVEASSLEQTDSGMHQRGDPGARNEIHERELEKRHPVYAGTQPPTMAVSVSPPAMAKGFERPEPVQFPEQVPVNKSGRGLLIAASIAVVLAAGWFITKTVMDGRKRAEDEAFVEQHINGASKSLLDTKNLDAAKQNIDAAAVFAREAKVKIGSAEVPLTSEKIAAWNPQIAKLEALKKRSDELQNQFEDGKAAPDKLKSAFSQAKAAQLDDQSNESKALLAQIEKHLRDVEDLRKESKMKLLQSELNTAGEIYRAGKIREAAEKARMVLNEMPTDPPIQDDSIKAAADSLIKNNDRMEAARRIRLTASEKNFADVMKKLEESLAVLDPKKEEFKPLIAAITGLKGEVAEIEKTAIKAREEKDRLAKEAAAKAARKLAPQDMDMLRNLAFALHSIDRKFSQGKADTDAWAFDYDGKPYRLGIEHAKATLLNPKGEMKLFVQCGANFIAMDMRHFMDPKQGQPPVRPLRAIMHALALGEAMKAAGVSGEGYWETHEEAPLVSGRRFDGKGNEYIFLGDRLYTGKANEKTDQQKQVEDEFKVKAEMLAVAIEKDEPTRKEIRDIIAMAVRAAATEAEWHDHLPGEYVREVINEGYVENNMPGASERLKKELAEFREGIKAISNPFLNFRGTNPDGDADELRTFEDHAVWRIYDQKSDTTTFAIKNPDDEKDCLFILYDYKGKVSEFPEEKPAERVRMTHQAVGATAEYVPATGKMTWDPVKWDLAASLELPLYPDEYRRKYGYGKPSWSLPPHVLLVDKLGHTKGIVTPYGRLDAKDFSKITDENQRLKEMDAFIDQIAKALPDKKEGSYLHLYYRYFFEYILDSPVTDHPQLLGSRTHCGDIHQTTQQSLMRYMGKRYVGDCDDLAEFFMTVTRKMGKLSYVMSLPAHAACGWVEKAPNESDYNFFILDTGPPRHFKNHDLDKVVEAANRAYDQEGTMRFDPKSLGFLFRFNGEPTRTPYYLSSRMYTDKPYGEAMEKVQSYWHFHFYALGIQTMLDMIEKKGDRVAENCNEVAGLYGQVREVEKSIHWSQESIKQMKSHEKLSRMSEEFRIASMWRTERENEKAYEAIKPTVDELNKLQGGQDSFNYLGMRMQVMGLLVTLERPFEAWEMIRPDIETIGDYNIENGKWQQIKRLKLEHLGGLTSAYLRMQDLIRNRKVLNSTESKQMQSLKKLLDSFYSNGKVVFEDEDDFNEYMRKYAYIGIYYAGTMGTSGRKKHLEELLKDGPYPDPTKKRDHTNRRDALKEDWDWIRLSIASYSIAIGDAIDLEEPPENWRIDEAVKLCDQMAKAGVVAEKFGSLGQSEYSLLSTRAFRAFLVKDWKDLEEVVKETAKRDWARLTTDIAETFGRGARFCTPEEFAAQYRMFTKYIKSKPAYFTVVYEAFRADGFKHSLEAAKIACGLNADDADMKRELGYLEGLVADRLQKEALKPKKKSKKEGEEKKDGAVPTEAK